MFVHSSIELPETTKANENYPLNNSFRFISIIAKRAKQENERLAVIDWATFFLEKECFALSPVNSLINGTGYRHTELHVSYRLSFCNWLAFYVDTWRTSFSANKYYMCSCQCGKTFSPFNMARKSILNAKCISMKS